MKAEMKSEWKPFGPEWVTMMARDYEKSELVDLVRVMAKRKIAACTALEQGSAAAALKILNGMADSDVSDI